MVGQMIVDRREQLGLNQYQLAKKSGVKQGHLSKIESGEFALPRRPTRDKLSKVLGFADEDYFRAAGVLGPPDDDDQEPPEERFAPVQLRLSDPDQTFDPEVIVRYVEAQPNPQFQERLRKQRERRTRASYVRFCVSLFRTWNVTADNVLSEAEEAEHTV